MTSKRVCVVTGANKGIGFAIVKELCSKFDGIVYLTSRDVSRGQAAIKELNELGFSPKFHQLDISDVKSIENLAKHLKDSHNGLDVLVNNAGIAFKQAATDSFAVQAEVTMETNYFGTVNVCHYLFPLLKPHARVVNVSSIVGLFSFFNRANHPEGLALVNKIKSVNSEEDVTNIMNEFISSAKSGHYAAHGFVPSCYAFSKVGVNALTKMQQQIFDKDERADLVVNSCHPGYVDTDMTSHKGPLSPEEGAACPSYLALLSANIEEPKGKYLSDDKSVIDWEFLDTPE